MVVSFATVSEPLPLGDKSYKAELTSAFGLPPPIACGQHDDDDNCNDDQTQPHDVLLPAMTNADAFARAANVRASILP